MVHFLVSCQLMMKRFDFNIPTTVIFGRGRVSELNRYLDPGIKKLLIVTDKNVAAASGALDKVLAQTSHLSVSVFDEVPENPPLSLITKGSHRAREENSEWVIGIGGGSPMDAAKGIALLAKNSGDMSDYMAGKKPREDALPVVCIPTSSGTGSEVTPFAVFTDPGNQNKGGYSHPSIFPRFSIIDPALTYSMPEQVVINTGFDAFTHCIEGYLSTDSFPLNDALALHGIRVGLEHLEAASRKDREAMDHMSYASLLGGIVIAHANTILNHIMAYPLTVFHRVPHGKANAVLMPGFLDFIKPRAYPEAQEKIAVLEKMFNAHRSGGINAFVEGFGISTRISDYGVEASQLELFAQKTIVKDDVRITPAHITEGDILELYRSVF
ncbi:MAG: iron-containing alcohol dehydrogenase [bacterium]|nr:iron-containing alcohol dehydrogenase [bacterium]